MIQESDSNYDPNKARYNWAGNYIDIYTGILIDNMVGQDMNSFSAFFECRNPNVEQVFYGSYIIIGYSS